MASDQNPDHPAQLGGGREIRGRLQQACAIAHGVGYRMSANMLMEYVYQHGLPSLEERERILAERLKDAEGDDTSEAG